MSCSRSSVLGKTLPSSSMAVLPMKCFFFSGALVGEGTTCCFSCSLLREGAEGPHFFPPWLVGTVCHVRLLPMGKYSISLQILGCFSRDLPLKARLTELLSG